MFNEIKKRYILFHTIEIHFSLSLYFMPKILLLDFLHGTIFSNIHLPGCIFVQIQRVQTPDFRVHVY